MIIITIFTALTTGCSTTSNHSNQNKIELHVMAAASLTDALQEIETMYEKKYNHINLIINYASSGTLQKQIEQGAPADLFLSAGTLQIDALNKKGLLKKETITNYLENELVLIKQNDPKKKLNSFTDLKQASIQSLSIGQPETVPAGKYAKETLQSLQLWETVQEKVVYAKDVRQALTYVETMNVEAGIVYKTDAIQSKKVTIVDAAPEESHEPILYPISIIENTRYYEEVKTFYQWLLQEEIINIFESYGFKGVNKTRVQ
ncbi:molybdate ABC transporter substrate-binding protein [Bacillus taeanensis]|uniref:Molybdate ABC transporter substrate-binding protein n=1 Tax=Bacillus taeanensis TaxID=273032 RepID=A0A366Y063_9BACI|nr:molybdate ABC transporter substrate-binding protein [Bacillus taeanensis]RBW69551.1 molybdate ABC transporter substrate-binding protein [Bacillus taeanensis]